ncbi:MAG: MGMT family protein [Chitinophagales bacterium]
MEKSFNEKVYDVVRQIPKGRATNYGAIAKYLATGRAARMVGWAMNNAHTTHPPVPAHRVVNRLGVLTGKHAFGDTTTMQRLLEQEGITVKNDQIQDFKSIFWDPVVEINEEEEEKEKN